LTRAAVDSPHLKANLNHHALTQVMEPMAG